jgi:hypothetical protein
VCRKFGRPRSSVRGEPDFCGYLDDDPVVHRPVDEADCVHCALGEADEDGDNRDPQEPDDEP